MAVSARSWVTSVISQEVASISGFQPERGAGATSVGHGAAGLDAIAQVELMAACDARHAADRSGIGAGLHFQGACGGALGEHGALADAAGLVAKGGLRQVGRCYRRDFAGP